MPGTNLWIPFQIQLGSSGSGEQEVGAPALGYNWQAFCTLNPAPAGQSQTISVSGQVVASGARQSGPFAAGSGQGVTVTIAGGAASSSVAGVLQGAILPGTAAQAPLPGNGNLFEISGGVIDVSGSDVTIQAGQTGINVSTDAPPVAGPNITIPAGQSSVTDTLHPPANATAIGFAFEPLATYDLQVTVQDALTLVYLENFTFPAAGPGVAGRSFTIPLTPGMTVSGIIVTATAGATLVVSTTVGYSLWYIGTNSIQPVNYPTQPLYVQGQGAEGLAATPPYTQAKNLDAVVVGNGAEALNEKSVNAIPIDVVVQGINASGNAKVGTSGTVDQIVQGIQGQGASVQTAREAPQICVAINSSISAGSSITLIAGVAGQSIRIRRSQLSTNAAAQIELEASGGAVYWVGESAGALAFPDVDFERLPVPAGEGLVIKNLGSGTVIVNGRVTADQY